MEKAQQNKHFQHGIWSNIIRPACKYKRTTISTKFHAYNSSHQTVAQQKHKKKKYPSSNSITKCEPLPIKKIKKKSTEVRANYFPDSNRNSSIHSSENPKTQQKKKKKECNTEAGSSGGGQEGAHLVRGREESMASEIGAYGARRERRRRGQEEEDAPTSQTPRPHLLLCTELKRWAAMAVGFLGAEIGGSGRGGAHGDGSPPLSPHPPSLYPFSECICIYLVLVPGLEQSCDTRPPVIGSEAVP